MSRASFHWTSSKATGWPILGVQNLRLCGNLTAQLNGQLTVRDRRKGKTKMGGGNILAGLKEDADHCGSERTYIYMNWGKMLFEAQMKNSSRSLKWTKYFQENQLDIDEKCCDGYE